jgi:hypothetical protein
MTKVLGLASREKKFNEYPASLLSKSIELQECTVIAINFVRARS